VPLLKESDREQLRQEFEKLQEPVKLVFFTQALDCDYCPLTQQVLEEVTGLSDKVTLQMHNFAIDKDQVLEYKIARVPAVAIVRVETHRVDGIAQMRDRDYGIRFYGVPAGYEFATLISDIFDVSRGDSGLNEQSKAMLAQLKEPLHLQVFSTPT
jgi:alkyl hydroperoxide reductase subunit AhpF